MPRSTSSWLQAVTRWSCSSWQDAAAYCNWLSDQEQRPRAYVEVAGQLALATPLTTGYRLPTEAEWEWAARYSGGGGSRRYPWGDAMPPPAGAGNYADRTAQGFVSNVLADYSDGYAVTAPVGSFSASPLGLFDLGGNAAEWVSDRYTVLRLRRAAVGRSHRAGGRAVSCDPRFGLAPQWCQRAAPVLP